MKLSVKSKKTTKKVFLSDQIGWKMITSYFQLNSQAGTPSAKESIKQQLSTSTFVPFVLACTGGLGPAATLTLKRIGNLLAERHDSPYCHFLRTRLSFALLRSALMCLRGTRSTKSKPFNLKTDTLTLAIAEGNGSH